MKDLICKKGSIKRGKISESLLISLFCHFSTSENVIHTSDNLFDNPFIIGFAVSCHLVLSVVNLHSRGFRFRLLYYVQCTSAGLMTLSWDANLCLSDFLLFSAPLSAFKIAAH